MKELNCKLQPLSAKELVETEGEIWGIFVTVVALGEITEAAGRAYKENYL